MTVSADEFLRRFLIHVLPKGLVRIRHFGLFANRRRGDMLSLCRNLLSAHCPNDPDTTTHLDVLFAPVPCSSSNGSPAASFISNRP